MYVGRLRNLRSSKSQEFPYSWIIVIIIYGYNVMEGRGGGGGTVILCQNWGVASFLTTSSVLREMSLKRGAPIISSIPRNSW